MDRPNSPTPLSNPTNRLEKQIWDAPAFGSKMPPSETFRLTKNLVEQRVKDNVIIVTFGNYAFMDFILTWVKHLTDLNVTNLLVGISAFPAPLDYSHHTSEPFIFLMNLFSLLLQVPWTTNSWKNSIGKVFPFSIWEAT